MNYELWLYNPAGTASKGKVKVEQQSQRCRRRSISRSSIGRRVEVIPGFDQGVRGMRVAASAASTFRRAWRTDPAGQRRHIPPNASLVFEVELTSVSR